MLEEVLCDLAARGAITAIQGAGNVDLLGPALEHELASIRRGGAPSHPPKWESKRSSGTGPAVPSTPKAGSVATRDSPGPTPAAAAPASPSPVPKAPPVPSDTVPS